jgi:hypothetical protein
VKVVTIEKTRGVDGFAGRLLRRLSALRVWASEEELFEGV